MLQHCNLKGGGCMWHFPYILCQMIYNIKDAHEPFVFSLSFDILFLLNQILIHICCITKSTIKNCTNDNTTPIFFNLTFLKRSQM